MHKAGFVNIVGNPNVGKSTLMNVLVGERISIATFKAQTTRHRIMGIYNTDDMQIVFSDTPGVLKPNYKLQESMLNFSTSALTDADVSAAIAEKNGLTKDSIDWVIPHQANLRIIDAVAHRLEVPREKVLINIERYGNTSAATLPLCIWDFEDKLKKGDNLIFTAFGAGFTWGAVYVKWGYDGKKQ